MNIVVLLFCVVLMILGASELCRLIVFHATKPLTKAGLTVTVTPRSAEDCEALLRATVERIRFLDFAGECKIICNNPTHDPEIDRLCRLFTVHYPALRAEDDEI